MNVELLTKVMNKLKRLRHKAHFDMDGWIYETECGTAACIAGHALLMGGYKLVPQKDRGYFDTVLPPGKSTPVDLQEAARKLLKLTPEQAERLFSAYQWPPQFNGSDPERDVCTKESVYNNPKIAAARIKHFIDTKGKE